MEYPLLRAGIEAVKASSPVKKEESKDEKPEVTPVSCLFINGFIFEFRPILPSMLWELHKQFLIHTL